MKKLIALLLAALMALTGAMAFAEAAPEAPALPMTISNAVKFDRDACRRIMTEAGMDAEKMAETENTLSLIEASGQSLVLAQDGFEYNMIWDGNTVATVAGDFSPTGVSIGSNLFPHYLLTVSNDTIAGLLSGLAAEEKAEVEAAAETQAEGETEPETEAAGEGAELLPEFVSLVREYSGKIMEMASSAIVVGEPVIGEYAVDGDTYNAMLPVSVDTRGIVDGFIGLVDEFIHNRTIVEAQATLRYFGIDIPLETPVVENVPAIAATVYSCQDEAGNANGPLYVEAGIDGADGASIIRTNVRLDGENVRVRLEIPANGFDAAYEQFQSDGGGFTRLDVNAGESYYGVALESAIGEESHFSFNVYYPDASTLLLSDDIAVVAGGRRLDAIYSSNKAVLSVERLMSGQEENGTWLSLLADAAINSVTEAMGGRNEG